MNKKEKKEEEKEKEKEKEKKMRRKRRRNQPRKKGGKYVTDEAFRSFPKNSLARY